MKFRYKPYPNTPSATIPDGVLYRPVIPLRITGNQGDAYVWALVDTGADETLMPRALAEVIGIEPNDARQTWVSGYGGSRVPVAPAEVTLQIGRAGKSLSWQATIGFAPFEEPEDEIALLGHAGALQFFNITFSGNKREVEITPAKNFPGRNK